MFNSRIATPRGLRVSRAVRVVALIALASGAAAVPTGIAGARSSGPDGRSVAGEPCLPGAGDDAYSTDMDAPLTVLMPGILFNDTQCGLSIQVVTPTSNGALNVDPGSGAFTYSPNPGFSGVDSFVYELFDPAPPPALRRESAPRGVPAAMATVTITVIPPCAAVAIDDAYATPQDVVLNIALPGVTVNDTHCDYFVHLYSNPDHGTLTLNADGTFQYTPDAGFAGIDSYEYALAANMPGFAGGPRRGVSGWRAPQGAGDNVATVTITVTPPPPTTTSTTTTTTSTTAATTTLPATTTTVPPAILPATR